MFRPPEIKTQSQEEGNEYWISFSDLMSAILILFILAALALVVELSKTQKEITTAIEQVAGLEQVKASLLSELQIDLKQQGISVEITDNKSVMRIPDTTLAFATNKATLTTPLEETVTKIGQTIYSAIIKGNRWKAFDTILVEGHTDVRSTAKERGNQGLSTDRANEILRLWEKKLPADKQLTALKNGRGEFLLGSSGYGAKRPLQKEQTSEKEYRKNRRIDIRFMTRTPALHEYQEIERMLEGSP